MEEILKVIISNLVDNKEAVSIEKTKLMVEKSTKSKLLKMKWEK